MRALGLPRKESRVDQSTTGSTPHLFDGIGPLVERVSRISNARKGPARPILAVLRHDLTLPVRFGLAPSHHMKAMRADDTPIFWPFWLHDPTRILA